MNIKAVKEGTIFTFGFQVGYWNENPTNSGIPGIKSGIKPDILGYPRYGYRYGH